MPVTSDATQKGSTCKKPIFTRSLLILSNPFFSMALIRCKFLEK